jgi:acyl carrier protein
VDGSRPELAADLWTVTEDQLRRALKRMVISMPADCAVDICFDTRTEDLGLDSLLIAELIVELEQESETMLDLAPVDRMDTLGDLCRALRPVPSFGP